MWGFIFEFGESHISKGYSTEVFKYNLAHVLLKGKSNLEAASQKEERAEVTIDLMKKANLQKPPSSMVNNRMTWCVISWLTQTK